MAQGLHLPKGLLGFQAEVKFLQGSDMAGLWERSPLAWELTRREHQSKTQLRAPSWAAEIMRDRPNGIQYQRHMVEACDLILK